MKEKIRPKISVIMAAYNSQHYVSEALESLECQTFNNFEVVLINDGSTDSTHEIISRFIRKSKLKINYINQKDNIGLTRSLNIAISQAKGEYLARMDADDISRPDRLSSCIEHLESNDLDFITTNAQCFSSSGVLKVIPRLSVDAAKRAYSSAILKYGNIFVHGTFFGKKTVFHHIRYDEKFRTAQDYDFLCRIVLSKRYKIGFFPKITYDLRIDENSSGRKKGSNQFKHAKQIAKKHFKTDFYLIPKSGLKRLFLAPLKKLYLSPFFDLI